MTNGGHANIRFNLGAHKQNPAQKTTETRVLGLAIWCSLFFWGGDYSVQGMTITSKRSCILQIDYEVHVINNDWCNKIMIIICSLRGHSLQGFAASGFLHILTICIDHVAS